MSEEIISVEGVSKKYSILPDQEERTLRARLHRIMSPKAWFDSNRHHKNEFWALRNVSFVGAKGDVIALLGRNGAGKTTLLRVISGVTEPSQGVVRIRGRVASLLGANVGFHHELTGRENIYLTGAILGVPRHQVEKMFSTIVDFAEIRNFIDQKVKHYSSGMNVRLGFSISVHLLPEVLILDEALAVGDAAFQERALKYVRTISTDERLIFFVSHDLHLIREVCNRAIVLDQGGIQFAGSVEDSITHYLSGLELKQVPKGKFVSETKGT